MNTPHQAYQRNSVQTASPAALIFMLYDGAIRFTKAGIEGIKSRKYDVANTNLKKAQSIVHELIASLNFDYPISKNLAQVYEYLLHQLIQANMKKDANHAEEVLAHLEGLRDTWKQVAGKTGAPTELASIGR
ncbi:flagellar export chaperone FliS [Paenibacillus sp. OV219]|uniref:flagellar export chaperone FliS n=1 Tax=Paenibacillus sp. OV219 TaxID=1884377 RepID=UPI0008C287F6|nr:flagellar protein FliS [Paenibacillus sp. OV219]